MEKHNNTVTRTSGPDGVGVAVNDYDGVGLNNNYGCKVQHLEENSVLDRVMRHLRDFYGINREECVDIMKSYGQTTATTLDNLRKAIEQNIPADIGQCAHSLKGGLLNLGMNELADTAYDLEKNSDVKSQQDQQELLAELENGLKDLVAWSVQ